MKNISNTITLMGMPASGKSTIGKILAKKLGWDFVDLDDLIKEKTGKSYDEILEQYGEEKLLYLENQLTLELDFSAYGGSAPGGKNSKGIVFSPGGSIIYSSEAMEKIKNGSRVIYIDLPLDEIEKRLKNRLIKGGIVGFAEKGLDKLFLERDPVYEKFADHVIEAENMKKEEVVRQISKLIKTRIA